MKKRIGLIGILVLLLIQGCTSKITDTPKSPDVQTSDKKSSKKEALYHCPMHPTIMRHKPGECPICGMDLVPVAQARSPKHEGLDMEDVNNISILEDKVLRPGVQVTSTIVQEMAIRTEHAMKMPFKQDIRAYAKLVPDDTRVYHIHPKVAGWVEQLHVTTQGEAVHKGEKILSFYSPEIYAAFQDYRTAIRSGNKLLASSTKKRLELWDVSKKQIREIAYTGKLPRTMVYESPIDGFVLNEQNLFEGMHITAGKMLLSVADITQVWAEVEIYEFESEWVQEGMAATMELPYLPGKTYKGKVTFVSPFVDEASRTIYARLEFPNPNFEIKPGMYANVVIHAQSDLPTLVIPVESVIRTGRRDIVFIKASQGKFVPTEVSLGKLGSTEDNRRVYEVLDGIQEHDEVVTSGQFMLDSESRLQEAILKMIEGDGKAGGDMQQHQH